MFVADQVYDRFVERFVARTEAMTLGRQPRVGHRHGLADLPGASSTPCQAHVDDAVAKGARVLTGGRARPDLGPYFYEPTILEGVTPDMTCFGDETFGPVISLYRFHDEADAVARANDGRVRPQRLDLQPGRRPRPRDRPPDQVRHGQHQRGLRRHLRQHRLPDGRHARVRAWAAARAARASTATPSRSRSATQRLIRFAPMLGMSDEPYAKVMTANLRLMKKLGRA